MKKITELDVSYEPRVIDILSKSNLPVEDIDLTRQTFIGYLFEGHLRGIGALEIHHPYALLRSIAVMDKGKNKGIGSTIITHLIDIAKSQEIKNLYLLTEAAQEFFTRKGFIEIERSAVPKPISDSKEFSQLCPSSATCMSLNINI